VWNLSVETEWEALLSAVDEIAFQQTQWKPAFQRIADEIGKRANQAIGTATGPDGYGPWRPHTKRYANSAQKGGSRAMLVLSGKFRSLTQPSAAVKHLDGTSMKYVVKSDFATTHQFGAHPTAAGFPGARVRNYMIWGDDLKKLFKDELNRYGEERRAAILKKAK
tara:strand:- start:3029 stop:3523 length:495 start_codon:yes stop_codon:yes gene_type:complete